MLLAAVPQMSFGEMASVYWPVLVCSFLVSLLATPVCRAVARARGIVDQPDNWLKPHKQPVAYLGGVAIFLGWAGGIIMGAWWIGRSGLSPAGASVGLADKVTIGVLLGGALIMGLGLFDDLRLASPKVKLAGNLVVALVLVGVGLGDDFLVAFLNTLGLHFTDADRWLGYVYSIPLAVFIVVGACNATNLLDGLDGLCGGVLSIIALGFLVLAWHMHSYGTWEADDVRRVVIALAMLGAALGFLPFNRNPATIFMGDAGSMLLGYTAAVMILAFAEERAVRWMLGAVVVMGLPIADMVLTLLRRWRAQRPLMQGDRSHFYDQLRDRGYSVRQVVVVSYILAALYAAAGCAIPIFFRTRYAVFAYLLVGVATLYGIKRFRMVRVESPGRELDGSGRSALGE